MRHAFALCGALLFAPLSFAQLSDTPPEGYTALFDGKTLGQWRGLPELWSVEDGALTGTTTADAPISANTFLVYSGDVPRDFELLLEFKIVGGNSGVQYRSKLMDELKFIVGGFQADIDSSPTFSGIHYEERMRGILATRGQRVVIGADGNKRTEDFAKPEDLQKLIKPNEWNSYRIVAEGNHTRHYINGELMSEVTDQQQAPEAGMLALQLHAGPPMRVQFRRLYLKPLKVEESAADVKPASPSQSAEPSQQSPPEKE